MYIQFKCVIDNNIIPISHCSLTLYFYLNLFFKRHYTPPCDGYSSTCSREPVSVPWQSSRPISVVSYGSTVFHWLLVHMTVFLYGSVCVHIIIVPQVPGIVLQNIGVEVYFTLHTLQQALEKWYHKPYRTSEPFLSRAIFWEDSQSSQENFWRGLNLNVA